MNNFLVTTFMFFFGSIFTFACYELPSTIPTKESQQKFVIEEGYKSIDLQKLNETLAEAEIATVTDLSYNRTFTVFKDVISDVFNTAAGEHFYHEGKKYSRTPYGIFTIDYMDRCPPWPSGRTLLSKIACSITNRLGRWAFWFTDLLIGLHGRPPGYDDKTNLYDSEPEDRFTTKGCIAAPEKELQNFATKVLSHSAFFDTNGNPHPALQKINQTQVQTIYEHTPIEDRDRIKLVNNAGIRITDFREKSWGDGIPGTVEGDKVKLDMRMLVINVTHDNWDSTDNLKEKQAFLKYLSSKKEKYNPKIPLKIVTDCIAEKDITLYKSGLSFNPEDQITTVKKGTQLKSLYRWPKNSNAPVQANLLKSENSAPTKVWLKNLDGFTCSKDYYWTSKNAELITPKQSI